MQVASILSDLTSLRVCDYPAALALVYVHKQDSKPQSSSGEEDSDVDMQRATDLVSLHYGVKMKHKQGDDEGLEQARRDVDSVLKDLKKNASS
ncbi:MAG: hypothetical protein Q9217_003785 [Psora testacea]